MLSTNTLSEKCLASRELLHAKLFPIFHGGWELVFVDTGQSVLNGLCGSCHILLFVFLCLLLSTFSLLLYSIAH